MSKKEYYLRSFTWGLPVNLGGAVMSLAMLATGHKPQKFGNCICFEVGEKQWGGSSAGIFMFTCKGATDALKSHELGHSIQNCYYGPLMPFAVNLPSSTRFLLRKAVQAIRPDVSLPDYCSIWFEKEASELGRQYLLSGGRTDD